MRVLVATDLSEAADVALRDGAAMASSPNDSLAEMSHQSLFFPSRDSTVEARAKEVVENTTAAVRARIASLAPRAEVFVDDGIDYAAIVRRAEAWKADVVVVGNHGHRGLARLIGNVATKVAHHAPCNVLVARAASTNTKALVVAATDGSNPSLPAVSSAALEARRRNASLTVVHAVGFLENEAMFLAIQVTPSARSQPDMKRIGDGLRDAVTKVGVEAKCEVLDGRPASAILRYATENEAALVVIGAHGNTNLSRAGMGSVADKVVRVCPCSVLVVRQKHAA